MRLRRAAQQKACGLRRSKLEALKEQRKSRNAEIEGAENVDYEALAEDEIPKSPRSKESLHALDPNEVTAPVNGSRIVAKVIELWTGIPAAKVEQNELEKLAHLEEEAESGTSSARTRPSKAVSAAIRRSRVQINPRRRPASFIFVGPTGTGKTELVQRALARAVRHPGDRSSASTCRSSWKSTRSPRLIGSPPGYVGYDEAGQLTEKVRRRPYSVLLFDEIEKAHPDVMNILLQILDEGRITDAHGRTVNFENTVIVMTSNAGSNSREALVGFNTHQRGHQPRKGHARAV